MFSNLLFALAAVLIILGVLSLVGLILVGKAVVLLVVGIICAIVAYFLAGGFRRGPGI